MTNVRDRISLYLSWLHDERHRRTVLIGLLSIAFALPHTKVVLNKLRALGYL